MRSETHLAGGVLVAAVGAGIIPSPGSAMFAVGAILGSVAPDSDIANPLGEISRKARRWGKKSKGFLLPTRLIAIQIQVLAGILGILLTAIAALFSLGHRKEMHSAWIAVILMLVFTPLALWIAPEFYVLSGMGAGWMMHRVLDSLTPSGIYWGKWKVRGPIVTGSLADRILGVILLVAAVLSFLFLVQMRG